MQKALSEMNVQSRDVISEIAGESGMANSGGETILAGERDPQALATSCGTPSEASRQTVAKSWHGNWREGVALRVARGLGDLICFAQSKIAEAR